MSPDQNIIALLNCIDSPDLGEELYPVQSLDFGLAEIQGVVPLLEFTLSQYSRENNLDQIVEASLVSRLIRYAHHSAAWELQLAAESKQALELIDSENPVILKGAVMAYQYYGQPHHRPMDDVDILISEDAVDSIRKTLSVSGFEMISSNSGEIVLAQFSCRKQTANGLNLIFDIHTRLFNRPGMNDLLGYDKIRAEANRVKIFGREFLAPSAAHCLIHACLHLMAHHANSRRLIWLYDIKLMLEKAADSDIQQFLEFTHANRLAKVMLAAINACDNTFPLNNSELIDELKNQANIQVVNPHPATDLLEPQSRANLMLMDWKHTRGLINRLKWLKEHLFPKPEYIQAQFGVRFKSMLWAFYLWRIIRGSVRLFTRNS